MSAALAQPGGVVLRMHAHICLAGPNQQLVATEGKSGEIAVCCGFPPGLRGRLRFWPYGNAGSDQMRARRRHAYRGESLQLAPVVDSGRTDIANHRAVALEEVVDIITSFVSWDKLRHD